MKLLLLAGTALLALTVSPSAARAVPFDFTFTGSLVTFTVPTTDTYQILAFGAQGGNGVPTFPDVIPDGNGGAGGRGAEIGGDFSLTAGEVLQIAVGGAGMPGNGVLGSGGGGGGGSFVVGPGNMPLVIAGAGGGGGGLLVGPPPVPNGEGGLTGPNGGGSPQTPGGTGGNGGRGGSVNGIDLVGSAGGGGFLSAGTPPGTGGGAFPDLTGGLGLFGNGTGGFGGGGGGGFLYCGGGGGGYSGGGGQLHLGHEGCGGGFGGGSFDAGTDQILMADFQTGNGEVIITELAAAIPEPSSIALLGVGLAGLAVISRRRRTVR
jgi:hypothetical protein